MKVAKTFQIKIFHLVITAIFLTLLSSPANAILMSRDFISGGDELLTFDSDTGLEWLDLSETLDQSYNSIIGGYGGYTTTYGFRYATNLEVIDLINNAGGDNSTGIGNLLDLLGCTTNCSGNNPGAFGIVPESGGIVEYSWFLLSGSNSDVFVPGSDGSLPDTGSLLVKVSKATPVPEPSTLLLFTAGIAAFIGFRSKKKRND